MQADVDKARALVVLSVLAVAVLMATAAWMGAGDRRVLDRGRRSGSPAAAAPIRSGAGIDSRWWNARWPYRLPVSVGAAGYARENGTPVEVELDFADRLGQVDASGERFSVEPYTQQNKWTGDLPAPEWVYFGDAGMDRVMYYARHGDDNVVDRFWRFGEGEMTVFGFGRGPREVQWERLRAVPARLTVGFAEENTFTQVRAIVRSATRPLDLVVGAPRARPDGAPSRGGSN